MYEQSLSDMITKAVARIHLDMAEAAPDLAGQIAAWLNHLAGTTQPEEYFKHPLAFPMLLLPWWLEKTIHPTPDLAFQADLIYSTLNGYYYIRLIDNLMDGQATVELKLLPALNFFHTQFQGVYHRYFGSEHPFWHLFASIWFHSAEVTFKDANSGEIDQTQFMEVTAKKVCAGRIPLAAVCCRYERPDLMMPWFQFFDLFGCWHQFLNDLLDWRKDLDRQAPTYFLAEARRRKNTAESVTGWVVRTGFTWGVETLQTWLVDLKAQASQLNSPPLLAYLETREMMLQQQAAQVAAGLEHVAKVLELSRPQHPDAKWGREGIAPID